jgi:hypothetical protein
MCKLQLAGEQTQERNKMDRGWVCRDVLIGPLNMPVKVVYLVWTNFQILGPEV